MSITPAFSPGPWITCAPAVGSVLRWILEDLYEQCSFHIAEKIPSSVMVGSRPINCRMRSYSSGLRPCSATSSGVIFGSLGIMSRERPFRPWFRGVGCAAKRFYRSCPQLMRDVRRALLRSSRCSLFGDAPRSGCLRKMGQKPGKQAAPVRASDRALHVVFGVRHQAEHVEL